MPEMRNFHILAGDTEGRDKSRCQDNIKVYVRQIRVQRC